MQAFQAVEGAQDILSIRSRFSELEGARGRWGRLKTAIIKAGVERRSRTFAETMPSKLEAPGLSAFEITTQSHKRDRNTIDKHEAAIVKTKVAPDDETPDDAPPNKKKGAEAPDYAGAKFGFKNQGKTFFLGKTEWDAEAAKKEWGTDVCIPYLLTRNLPGAPNCCPTPGHPDHCDGGKAHLQPEGKAARGKFNLKKASNRPKPGGGKPDAKRAAGRGKKQ